MCVGFTQCVGVRVPMRSLAPLLPPIPWRGTASGKSTALGHGLGCDGGGSPRPQVMKCVPRSGGAPLPPHGAHRRGGHRWCWGHQAVRHSPWRCRIACVCEGGVPNRPRTLTPRDPASGRIHQPAGLGEMRPAPAQAPCQHFRGPSTRASNQSRASDRQTGPPPQGWLGSTRGATYWQGDRW